MGEVNTKAEAEALVKEKGSKDAAARAAGMNRTTFRRRLMGVPPASKFRPARVAAVAGVVNMTDLVARYDCGAMLVKQLEALGRGQFLPDQAMRLALGNPGEERWRRLSRSERVAQYRLPLPDKSWVWGHAADVAEAKRKIMEGTI